MAVNLLTCRLERGIQTARTTRALLQIVDPKVQEVARGLGRAIRYSARTAHRDLVAEIQSVVIEKLLTTYMMGEPIHPLYWLFGRPAGAVTAWAQRRQRAARRDKYRYGSLGTFDSDADLMKNSDAVVIPAHEYDEHAAERERLARVLAVLDDGLTLSALEYRVVAFCFRNARESTDRRQGSAPTRGLHAALAQRLDLPRATVTRVYGEAVRKLLHASGEMRAYFSKRGITQLPRRAVGRVAALSADEISTLLEHQKRLPVDDLIWLYGVPRYFIHTVLGRFKGLSREGVRAACR